MRILILNSEYPPLGGGAGNASANIARCLAARGHEIALVTARFKDLPHEEKFGNVVVYRVPAFRRKRDRSSAFEQLAFILSASFWTAGLIPRFKPNITLAFFGVPSGAVALLLKIIYKIPYIISLRGGDVPGFRPYDFRVYHRLIGPFLRVIWHNASTVVANSKGLRELANTFDAKTQIRIISNGVEAAKYATEDRDWSPPRLFSVGRIVYQKGFDLAMHALADIKNLSWEWCIAGDGPHMKYLRSLAHKLGIDDRVIFLGWQSREEVIKRYQKANLFIFPSRHEGMPNAVLEAMASGLPVIASRIAGNEDLVLEGKTGILFPSEDVDALVAALKTLLNDPILRRQMGSVAREFVEEQYSWERVSEEYEQLLEKLSRTDAK